MTDRDRLIELISESEILCDTCGECSNSYCAEALADYLLANGVIVPPCKVGDTVYVIYNNKIIKGKVDSFDVVIEENETSYVAGVKFFDQIAMIKGFSFGLNVFLTKAEAYKEFAERVKEKYPWKDDYLYSTKRMSEDIDNLLKEMVGEDNG